MVSSKLRVGVAGPVGSGKTALVEALCRCLRERLQLAVVASAAAGGTQRVSTALTAGLVAVAVAAMMICPRSCPWSPPVSATSALATATTSATVVRLPPPRSSNSRGLKLTRPPRDKVHCQSDVV